MFQFNYSVFRHVSNIQVFFLRKTCTMQICGISFIHPYKQSGRWQDMIETKHLEKFLKKPKVHFVTCHMIYLPNLLVTL